MQKLGESFFLINVPFWDQNEKLGGVFGFRPEFGLFKKGPIYVWSKAFFFLQGENYHIFVQIFLKLLE